MHTEQVSVHPARRFGGCQRADTDQKMGLFGEPAVNQCLAVTLYLVEFKAVLGLKKLRSIVDLGLQSRGGPVVSGFGGHFRGTEEKRVPD